MSNFIVGQIKCRSVKKRVEEEVSLAESSAFSSMLDIVKEIKQCGGKRGASVRLKRVLEEESRDGVKRAKKETQDNEQNKKKGDKKTTDP